MVSNLLTPVILQIKSLSEMGWFLTVGTASQIVALVILIYKVKA